MKYSSILKTLMHRIYADFLMPSRLSEYRSLLATALEYSYNIYSIRDFWEQVRAVQAPPPGKHLILRHDIDSDTTTARAMWGIERELGIISTYFFRRSTLDTRLISEMGAAGLDIGYHYEELATLIKEHHLRTHADAAATIPLARERFATNLAHFRNQTGLTSNIIASHGDWANRRLQITNTAVLDSPELRKQVGVELEAYDASFMKHVTSRHSDAPWPKLWAKSNPEDAFAKGEDVVYILVHPRQWRANVSVNLQDDMNRIVEYIRYRSRC